MKGTPSSKPSSLSTLQSESAVQQQLEILLKEYETLRTESMGRETTRTQLTNIAAVTLGVIATIGSLIFGANAKGSIQIRIDPHTLSFFFSIFAFLMLCLMYIYLLQDYEVMNIAQYIRLLRERMCSLLALSIEDAPILRWDYDHMHMINPKGFWNMTVSVTLTLSRYGIMLIPFLFLYIYAAYVELSIGTSVISLIPLFFNVLIFIAFFFIYWHVYQGYLTLMKNERNDNKKSDSGVS